MPELNEPLSANKLPSSSLIIFAYPFRIFFLSVAAWAIVIVPLWLLIITGAIDLPLAVAPQHWHRHEILFGLLNPAIAGFLLTAVCVWTNTERLHGGKLAALWLVWLAGRLAMLFGEAAPFALVAAINLAFLPLAMLDAGWRIRRAKQYKQLIILLVLGLLCAMQAAVLFSGELRFVHAALVMAILLMLVIGGRITPAFSINWLKRHGYSNPPVTTSALLEKILIPLMLGLFIATLFDYSPAIAVLALSAAAVSSWRLLLWRGWLIRSEPLLWILHLSLCWIPLGLLLLTAGALQLLPKNLWQHAIGIGAMSGLIFGVMTRVSLGHTGRELRMPAGIVSAYWLIQAAVILRLLTALNSLPWQTGLTLSALCWMIAFGLFLWRYIPILSAPRVDGRPG
jgi:uncharacterized protein involved in response to NO